MKLNKINIAAIMLAATALVGCANEDVSEVHYDNKLYISTSSFTDELLIKATTTNASREITLRTAQPVDQEVTASVIAAPELLDTYRASYYNPEAALLAPEHYEIVNGDTKINIGSVSSTPVTLNFLATNELNRDICYVLPVRVASVVGVDVLPSAQAMYYVFRGAALINIVPDLTENRAWPVWKNPAVANGLRTFTLEALVKFNKFEKSINTIMGIEGKFLLRMGDSAPKNQLQIATSGGNLTHSSLQFQTNAWTHLAVTFNAGAIEVYLDGVKQFTGSVSVRSVDLGVEHSEEDGGKPRCFWFGYSYDSNRHLDGLISEARIWNKVLTAEEINAPAHFYLVEPDADGLVGYWKFDEGAGTAVKDQTSNGNDVTIENLPNWVKVSLPEVAK